MSSTDEDASPARADGFGRLSAAGLALASAGVPILIVAAVMGRPEARPLRDPSQVHVVFTVAAVALALVTSLAARDAGRHAVIVVGLAAAGLLAWSAVWELADQYAVGFPQAHSSWVIVGSLAALVGLLVVWWARPPAQVERVPGVLLAATSLAVVGALLASALLVRIVERRVVDHTTAAAVDVPPAPHRVAEVAWRTELPEQVRGVMPAGAGVVAAFDDGVAAYDGLTGEERWRYRRHGIEQSMVHVAPDGRTALLVIAEHGQARQLVALDAVTGDVRFTSDPPPRLLALSNETYAWIDGGSIVAQDNETGQQLWEAELPANCPNRLSMIATPFGFVVACGESDQQMDVPTATGVILLDGRTGATRWAVFDGVRGDAFEASPDGRVVQILVLGPGDADTQYVDVESGEMLTDAPDDGLHLAYDGEGYTCRGEGVCEFVDLRTGESRELDKTGIEGHPIAVFPAGAVFIDPEGGPGDRPTLVRTFDGESIDVELADVEAYYATAVVPAPGSVVIVLDGTRADGSVTTYIAGLR